MAKKRPPAKKKFFTKKSPTITGFGELFDEHYVEPKTENKDSSNGVADKMQDIDDALTSVETAYSELESLQSKIDDAKTELKACIEDLAVAAKNL